MDRRELLIGAAALTGAAALSGQAQAASEAFTDRFSVVVKGHGPDILFIHGLDSSREVFNDTYLKFEMKYRFHFLQLGGSVGEPLGGMASGEILAPTADAIANYITKSGLKKVALVGHSMGGTLGLMVAARHPAVVSKLMVVDMVPNLAPLWFGPDVTAEDAKTKAAAIRDKTINGPQAAVDADRTKMIAGMVKNDAKRVSILNTAKRSNRDVAGREIYELLTTDLTPELPKITAPTTVLYPWDTTLPYSQAVADKRFAEAYKGLKKVKLVRIDGSYHFIMADQPDAFYAQVAAFMGGK